MIAGPMFIKDAIPMSYIGYSVGKFLTESGALSPSISIAKSEGNISLSE
jgi:hypothetical protein